MNQYVLLLIVCCLAISNGFVFPSSFPLRRLASKEETKMHMITGRVKFFDSIKGFGFISPDNGGEDVFVHQTAIFAQGFRSLGEGELVEFELNEDTVRGKKFATNVTGPNGAPVQGAPRPPRDEYARY